MKTFIVDTSTQIKQSLTDLFEFHYPSAQLHFFSTAVEFDRYSGISSVSDLVITENPNVHLWSRQAGILFISDNGIREFPATHSKQDQTILQKPIHDDAFVASIKCHLACCQLKNLQEPILRIPDLQGSVMARIDQIIRCEGLQKCTRVVLCNRPQVISSYNIGVFRDVLSPFNFLAVHKSHLVNSDHIYQYDSDGLLILSDGSSIPVSRRRKSNLFPNNSCGPQLMAFHPFDQ